MVNFESLALKYSNGKVSLLDQTLLPHEERWIDASSLDSMIEAIKHLRVRGAPLIGVAAGFALACLQKRSSTAAEFTEGAARLKRARPTAVNLAAAVDRCLVVFNEGKSIEAAAMHIANEDVELCKKIAENGASVIADGSHVMTICNAGGLATAGVGTAIGVLARAWEAKKKFHVFVPETRPLGQGARLTTWELGRLGIPHTLICDNMVGATMRKFNVRTAVVGADRVAANGDFANKIGTYNMSILAKHHGTEFFVAAPYTTFDLGCPSGLEIPIEERSPQEVRGSVATKDCEVFNPAFDVTPASLVNGWITDRGLFTRASKLPHSH